MIKNSTNLTSAASEIISSSSSQRNKLFSAGRVPRKLITKSYKITNDSSHPDSLNNERRNISRNSIKRTNNKSFIINNNDLSRESKGTISLNLSNIQYKDGYVLKDAVNSNPGYGLWSIKIPQIEKKSNQNEELSKNMHLSPKKEESKNDNGIKNMNIINYTNNINSINIINDNSNLNNNNETNYKYTKYIDNEKLVENHTKTKNVIGKLSNKLNDLEKKYMKALSNFYEKKYLCRNSIKMQKEYDLLLKNNVDEIKILKDKTEDIGSQNKVLEDALSNTRNEINRLLNVMKDDKNNMKNLKEEYEDRIKKEEIERERLNDIIKVNEQQIEVLNEKTSQLADAKNLGFEKLGTNDYIYGFDENNENKKEFEIKALKEIALNLQVKISNLKKEIKSNDEEIEKLNDVMKYKNIKDEYQKNNINNLFYLIEENEINSHNNNNILKNKNEIIRKLNENIVFQKGRNIKLKKLPRSSSQSILLNKKAYNL